MESRKQTQKAKRFVANASPQERCSISLSRRFLGEYQTDIVIPAPKDAGEDQVRSQPLINYFSHFQVAETIPKPLRA